MDTARLCTYKHSVLFIVLNFTVLWVCFTYNWRMTSQLSRGKSQQNPAHASPIVMANNSISAPKYSEYVVPNIVHFIWFAENSERQLKFVNYMSIRSAFQIHKPETIMLHCNHLPAGEWWQRLWHEVPLQIMYRNPPTHIYGQTLKHMYHKGDITKFEIIMEYGGMYLDYDVIVLKSLNPLRYYDATLGKEKPPKFIAGIVIGRQNATFFRLLHESYRGNYQAEKWDYNCAIVAYELYLKHPELLHVEQYKLTTPDYLDRRLLWNDIIDWSDLYVIHLMSHASQNVYTPQNIQKINTTFGQIMRFIYHGSPALIEYSHNQTSVTYDYTIVTTTSEANITGTRHQAKQVDQ